MKNREDGCRLKECILDREDKRVRHGEDRTNQGRFEDNRRFGLNISRLVVKLLNTTQRALKSEA